MTTGHGSRMMGRAQWKCLPGGHCGSGEFAMLRGRTIRRAGTSEMRNGCCARPLKGVVPRVKRVHSKTIGHITAPDATNGDQKHSDGQTLFFSSANGSFRDQELSGIGSRLSMAAKTAPIAYRASVPST